MPSGLRRQVDALDQKLRRAARYEQNAWLRRLPVRDNQVFYESFDGNGMLCNPEAIFRALLAAEDLQHLKHVWAISDFDTYATTIAEFADDPRVKFVRVDSSQYQMALATSKYLINNATFPPMFAKRAGQVYLNTWHGTPLKAMGYDMPGGGVLANNVVRNFMMADYLLAPNDATEDMYLRAFRMTNVFRGGLIRTGTPRIDKQFTTVGERAAVVDRLRSCGVQIDDGQQIVLYAPTWKGEFHAPTNDVRQLRRRLEALNQQIDTSKYRVLLKVHQQVFQFAVGDADLKPTLVPNEIPANDVLAATDVLITDYSSIFVDFLATGRPVLFFTPDLDEYDRDRRFNVPPSEWPGPLCRDIAALAAGLNSLHTGSADDPTVTHANAYAAGRERYCTGEDGKASQRLLDIVFRGHSNGPDVRRDCSDGRQTILMYLGGILPNGITMSALSLLENIDYTRFDVSVFYAHTTRKDRLALIKLIPDEVRLLPRVGGMLASKLQVRSLKNPERRAARGSHSKDVVRYQQALHDEWVRCFGDAQFDHVIDFSAYAPLWDKILMQGKAKSFSMWMHSDLDADAKREVDGRFLHRANLHGIFELYRHADHLVSVSPALAEINRGKLSEYAEPEKFTYARNTINYRRVLHLAYGLTEQDAPLFEPAGRDTIAQTEVPEPVADASQTEVFHPTDLRGSIDKLMGYHDIALIKDEADRRANIQEILPRDPEIKTFVSAGRLSPEKNFARMIKAFDIIHQQDPKTRLVILGAGPMRASLDQVVADLGLAAAVSLPGYQANPYGVMAQADCFVLSSDYEGQPMVLLEALVLGLPVVTTRFASVESALPKGCGLIVEPSVKALAAGMQAFLRGEVPTEPFDYVAYNREATDEFYRAIGARVEV